MPDMRLCVLVIKEDVELAKFTPEAHYALGMALMVATMHGLSELVLTSVTDGVHIPDSLHPGGGAFDVRRWNIPNPQEYTNDLGAVLGPDFDVVLELSHVHVEHDPR